MLRKLFLTLCSALLAAATLYAQKIHVDEISIDTRATFHQQTLDGKYSSSFLGDYLNLHIKGQLTDNLSFRIRQRLNRAPSIENPFNATDFLMLRWQPFTHWAFTAGKQAILLGGYEIDSAPIDVYYYGTYCEHMHQVYAFGLTANYLPAEGQEVILQFCPSPCWGGVADAYSYNLYWNGSFAPFWKTTWSVNFIQDQWYRWMNYIVLGNRFFMGPLALDIDFHNRASFAQKRFFLSDYSIIGKAILTLGKWNLCTKVGYETNATENVDEDGRDYDTILAAGTNYFYAGAGVEYFPLGNDNLRLHAVWFRDNTLNLNHYDMGITWRFTVYKR